MKGDEIKVAYRTARGAMSKAYVTAEPPHVGIDKYTDVEVVLEWHADEWEWRQVR